ncbi:helix-turn-helix domain-containing protein [Paraburkholderia bryophila]|uniref:helix-turn-helix domain-containing protein n=1 Tax=Paraburkholderia bryophila TaxID=420952 RepID=UPI00234ABFFC|nr:helix-turn-helix domain-containing protein [Paraburkholderia bryophila]WCM21373.1 helix-turn-helix domain-containing protein [Paraburkholderia bryophila]
MGRPSKLTDAQWETLGKRLLANESAAALAREYGISKASISSRFSKRVETIKTVANQIVEVERSLSFLNVSEQIAARSLADDLKAISEHLAGAARFGAATSHRLAGIAHNKVAEIDDAQPLTAEGIESLKDVAVLTRIANSSSEIAINLLRANKETVDDLNRQDLHPEATKRIREVKSGMSWVYGALESDEEES